MRYHVLETKRQLLLFQLYCLLDASSTASTTLGVLIGRVAGFSLHNKTPSRYGTYVEC